MSLGWALPVEGASDPQEVGSATQLPGLRTGVRARFPISGSEPGSSISSLDLAPAPPQALLPHSLSSGA